MGRTTSNVAHKVRRFIKLFVASEPCLLPRQAASDVLEFSAFKRASITKAKAKSWGLYSVGALSASQTGNLRRLAPERHPLHGGTS